MNMAVYSKVVNEAVEVRRSMNTDADTDVAILKAIAKLLLDHGAELNKGDRSGRTPLYLASEHCKRFVAGGLGLVQCDKDLVSMLLQKGAKPNQPSNNGMTPLHCAIMNNSKEVIQLLLDHGAEPNKGDRYGKTPLHCAIKDSHKDVRETALHWH